MKKEEAKKKIKSSSSKVSAGKKEKVTLEKLASLIENLAVFTMNGFKKMGEEIAFIKKELSSVKEEVASVKEELSFVKEELSSVKEEVASVKEDQKDSTRRLVSIERKLSGTLLSLDETVHRSEFDKLAHRVEALES